jgi:methyl-accepting chemotaxis protein PixJ
MNLPDFKEENSENISNLQQQSLEGTKQKNTLRRQLLLTVMPTVMLPLLVASFIGYNLSQNRADRDNKEQLKQQSLLSGEAAKLLLDKFIQEEADVAENPYVINLLKNIKQLPENQKLEKLSIAELEKSFAATKSIKLDKELNNYLQSQVKTGNFSEISITDSQGLNIGYSNLPSDFVQRDEAWWQKAKKEHFWIEDPEFDDFSKTYGIDIVRAIKDPQSGEFLGVVKAVIPSNNFELINTYLEHAEISGSQQLQLVEANTKSVLNTFSAYEHIGEEHQHDETEATKDTKIIGGDVLASAISIISQAVTQKEPARQVLEQLKNNKSLQNVQARDFHEAEEKVVVASFVYGKTYYSLATVPNTSLVTSVSINNSELYKAESGLLTVFLITAIALGGIAVGIVLLLAHQLTFPLSYIADRAEQAAQGDLDILVEPVGTLEVKTVAHSFNNLIAKVRELLQQQSSSLQELEQARQQSEIQVRQQQEKNQKIQQELLGLLTDVEGASSGDLTVRSRINDGEIGIVADFFNSIIENLRDIVSQVKQATNLVSNSVDNNRGAIDRLTTEAYQQTEQITKTLTSIEQMTRSIQEISQNAQSAAKVASLASSKAEMGGASMERTVNSIVQLRDTIDETAEKAKRLGDASQQISRVTSLINQIAMQTNLLAINASIEAARAGDAGKGFAVVAEEVGQLATQSTEATKEIENIISTIQKEILQVVEAMETGSEQAEAGTRLVENSKASLEQIVEVSQQIDFLVKSISQNTISQVETSETVRQLMAQIAQLSTKTSTTSSEISDSLASTVAIAHKLQSSVDTFKVDPD